MLDHDYVDDLLRRAFAEDLADGPDATSTATIPADHRSTGRLVARRGGVVAGLDFAVRAFTEHAGADCAAHAADGDAVAAGDVLLTVTGPTRGILTAERTALNFVCHLSGIATATRRWADAVAGTGAVIRDTRKTTPGLRLAEKWAVRCGGGANHRMSLSDEALVKDNHIVAAGGVAAALHAVRALFPGLPCEVECDTLDQVAEAVDAGAELILLDNMDVATTAAAVRLVAGRARTEASGGLTLDNAAEVARTGVDFLAVGALTHSAPALDIGLDLEAL